MSFDVSVEELLSQVTDQADIEILRNRLNQLEENSLKEEG
jgi:hypothetical protein